MCPGNECKKCTKRENEVSCRWLCGRQGLVPSLNPKPSTVCTTEPFASSAVSEQMDSVPNVRLNAAPPKP